MFRISVLFLYLAIFVSCTSQEAVFSPKEFSEKISQEKVKNLIDVRTPDEYKEGYIMGAVNIDWNSSNFETELGKLDRNTPLYLYCLSGGRSGNAIRKAKEMGFKKIYGLTGGVMAWRAENLALASNSPTKKTGLTKADYEALYKGKSKKILVDFYAEWCAPCQKMKPFLKKIETTMSKDVEVIRINADENPELCKAMEVKGLPYVLIYKGDQLEWSKFGFASEEELVKIIKK
jgi:thioredoxin 1